jgi:hypothetical protein
VLSLASSVLSASLAVAQSNTSITLSVPSPAAGTVQITGSAKGGGVVRVDIAIDGASARSCGGRQCTTAWNTASTVNGQHRVQARATLRDGRSISTERLVMVDNEAAVPAPSPPAAADVAPSGLHLEHTTVDSGSSTPLQLTVSNLGTATADAVAVTIAVAANGTTSQAARISVGALPAGASGTVSTSLSAPMLPGTYSVIATAATSTPELSTANNTTTTSLDVVTSLSEPSGGATSPAPTGPVYYLSPNGNDGNPGTQASPWRTFAYAVRRLVAGDTLVLLDGKYDLATTGVLSIDCASNAQHGTASAPITVRAQNERQALIQGDGRSSPVKIQNCSYWQLSGLYTRQVDNSLASPGTGQNVYLVNSHHLTVRRCLAYGANRYTNVSVIVLQSTHDSLVEECESYFFHRKGISLGVSASRNVIRRNYVHSRAAADVCTGCEGDSSGQSSRKGDEGINLAYPGSDNIAENNISEGSYIGFVVNAKGTSDRNRFYGNIALGNDFGFLVTSRGAGASRTPHDTVLENNVAAESSLLGVYLRGAENTRVSSMTVLGSSRHGLAADHSSLDYIAQADECNAQTAPCGNGASSTHVVNSLALVNAAVGLYIVTAQQEGGWSIDHSNAYGNSPNYSPSSAGNLTSSSSVNPLLGACRVWIPEVSPMKRSGRDAGDVGANILYRYEKGRLTTTPVWDARTGGFPQGALVSGVNDVAGQSAFDVHQRLNVNTNGCEFPIGYGQ